jgi:hypothetical protein
MLTDFHARRFRTFEHLDIARLGRVNLVVGRNNVGKTMLLHALRLFQAEGTRGAIIELLRDRDELARSGPQSGSERGGPMPAFLQIIEIAALFHGREPKLGEDIVLESTGQSLRLSFSDKSTTQPGEKADTWLNIDYCGDQRDSIPMADDFVAWLDARSPRMKIEHSVAPLLATGSLDATRLATWWDTVSLTDAEKRVIDCMRIISPVERIALVDNTYLLSRVALVKVEGMATPIPLRALGDGVGRMFAMALAMEVARSSKLLLIDEIENGIHYSILPDFWRFLFRASTMSGVQIVATSHSWDCIEAFQQAANDDPGSAALIKLSRKDGRIASVVFDDDDLRIATRDGIELR